MLLIYLIMAIYYLETVFRIAFSGNYFGVGLFYSFGFVIPIATICYLICTAFKKERRSMVGLIILGMITFVFISQFVYYKIFRMFYTLYSAGNAGQIFEFLEIIVINVKNNIGPIALMLVPFVMMILLKDRLKAFVEIGAKERVALGVVMLLTQGMTLGILNLGSKDAYSPYDLYYKHSYPIISAEKLGLITTLRLDAKRMFFDWNPGLVHHTQEVVMITEDTEDIVLPEMSTPAMSEGAQESDKEVTYNVLEVDFDKLISEAESEELKEMHTYFKEMEPTAKNAFTGKYEGYNLIQITAEGFSPYAISKELTPTLYMLSQKGYQFTNFYTPLWELSTSDGEYAICSGQIPKSGVWSMETSSENAMPFSLGNQLKRQGYKTMAFHNHTFDYYRRDLSHPNLGYEYLAKGNGLDMENTWPESDEEMMEESVSRYVGNTPFHTYYMTVSGHMNYSFFENDMSKKHRKEVEDLPLSDTAKAYLGCNIELDRAVESLLEQLEEAGVLEHTLIAITPDHYPYGLSNEYISELAGKMVDEQFGVYRSTFLLYTPHMTPQVITKPCSSLDILPTLSNLMGLDYDSRLFVGKDIFSDSEALVMLYNRNFITDKGRYNAITKEFTAVKGADVDEKYVREMIDLVEAKFYYSAKVLEEDYYEYVLSAMNKKF